MRRGGEKLGTRRIATVVAAVLVLSVVACVPEAPSVDVTDLQIPAPVEVESPDTEIAIRSEEGLEPTSTPTPTRAPAEALKGDFGDAPDGLPARYPNTRIVGRFPTRLHTDSSTRPGAHVLNSNQDRLGINATTESDAEDQRDPDGQPNLVNADNGDDGVRGITVDLSAAPVQGRLRVRVTLSPTAPPGPRFINVLIDSNRDGRWSNAPIEMPEWAVVNWRVLVKPGTGEILQSPAFPITHENQLPNGAWMRVLLTRKPISSKFWDGSGRWDYGEVEDYQLVVAGFGSESGPTPALSLKCPNNIPFSPAVFVVEITCFASNLGADSTLEATFIRAAGDSLLVPDQLEPQLLRAGRTIGLPFVIIRGEGPARWRYRAQVPEVASSVKDGVVTLGVHRRDRNLNISEIAATEPFFRDDAADDYFSVLTGESVEGFAFGDIRRAALGKAHIDTTGIGVLRQKLMVIESGGAPGRHDNYIAVIIEMGDQIPIESPALGIQISVAFESTGDSSDNWIPLVREFDLFQGTDQWYELIYQPKSKPTWQLQRREATTPNLTLGTDALAFLLDHRVLMLIPASEFIGAPETLRYRITAFVHEPDDPTGDKLPSAADTLPDLDQPLAVFGTNKEPRG